MLNEIVVARCGVIELIESYYPKGRRGVLPPAYQATFTFTFLSDTGFPVFNVAIAVASFAGAR